MGRSCRICVATYYNDDFAPIGTICAKTLRRYTDKHGFDLHVETEITSSRPPAWNKILLMQRLLNRDYDYILWVDADALFIRFAPDIRAEIVEGKDLFLVSHEIRQAIQPGAWLCLETPNTGVMLLRNSNWTRSFLDKIWQQTHLINHQFWENAAVHELLGYHFLVNPSKRNAPVESMLSHIAWLDLAWNSVPGACESAQPVIHHYAGYGDRIGPMRRDFALAERAWADGI